jgi:hypothetical protein
MRTLPEKKERILVKFSKMKEERRFMKKKSKDK